MEISIYKNGETILDKKVTIVDVIKTSALLMMLCLLLCGTYDSLNLHEHLRFVKWI